jgi:ribosomal protein L40E
MIKTTYICDRCSAEQPTIDQFWSIGVWAVHNAGSYSDSAQEHKRSIQVCRPCLEAFGVNVQRETKAQPSYVERTTEDILTELLERIGR